METITLQKSRKINIDIWDNNQIQKYVDSKDRPITRTGMNLHYKNFDFFGLSFVKKRLKRYNFYPDEKNLPVMENQNIK